MSIDQEVEILRNIPMFAKIDPPKLKLMAFASERLTFRPGQELFKQGEAGDSAYIVVEGEVAVFREGSSRVELTRLGEGAFFGRLAREPSAIGFLDEHCRLHQHRDSAADDSPRGVNP